MFKANESLLESFAKAGLLRIRSQTLFALPYQFLCSLLISLGFGWVAYLIFKDYMDLELIVLTELLVGMISLCYGVLLGTFLADYDWKRRLQEFELALAESVVIPKADSKRITYIKNNHQVILALLDNLQSRFPLLYQCKRLEDQVAMV